MKTDTTAKILLTVIALALWLNVIGSWVNPTVVQPQNFEISWILQAVQDIANGTCDNPKICSD